ncbi:MAG: TIGR04255 family protein [Planctomycetes bacterium]|nr:TIGR04255 family protein [Planctomycetota bacterium]
MTSKKLKNPPLVEVILEVRWELQNGPQPQVKIDPHYSILLGRLYDKLQDHYPYHEPLPQASIPDEISAYMVKQRFRREKDGWPLIQLGPGILTLNDTQNYNTFEEFRPLALSAVSQLFEVYPESENLKISSLLLRYIDAKEFDYKTEDIQVFLCDKMGIPLSLPEKLFQGSRIEKMPRNLSWKSSFPCNKPKGLATLVFATGVKNGKPALVWEQIVKSAHAEVPDMPGGFEEWIVDAHNITESWFVSLIAGDLEQEFNNG